MIPLLNRMLYNGMAGAVLIVIILLLRLVIKRLPKYIYVWMWCVAGVRMIIPFSFKSIFGILPDRLAVSTGAKSVIVKTMEMTPEQTKEIVQLMLYGSECKEQLSSLIWIRCICALWIIGICCMLAYMLFAYIKVCIKVKNSKKIYAYVYEADMLTSAFVLGILRPRIYLPMGLSEKQLRCVLTHERAHITRKDHVIKFFGFFILCVQWMNPFAWIAYHFLCTDIEYACDERVIKELGLGVKKEYAEALLQLSMPHKPAAVWPLAFGEINVKRRIMNIKNFKKVKKISTILGACLVIILAVCFLTNSDDKAVFACVAEEPKSDENVYIKNQNEVVENQGEGEIEIETGKKESVDKQGETGTEEKEVLESHDEQEKYADAVIGEISYLCIPVEGTQSYSFCERVSPITGEIIRHNGIDIKADLGATVVAAWTGKVLDCGFDEQFGNYVIINHNNDVQTFYGNCSEIIVSIGDAVECGQEIALVGSTGNSTGPHLHFGVMKNREWVNPEYYFVK